MNEPGPRRLELEMEVPGTPDQIWAAIATGPGIASWFMPMEIDGREGLAAVRADRIGVGNGLADGLGPASPLRPRGGRFRPRDGMAGGGPLRRHLRRPARDQRIRR